MKLIWPFSALRLLPVLPNDSRVANQDTILPTGGGEDGKSPVFVPSGSMVTFSIMALHRRKDLWGEDAEEFHPERWEKERASWVSQVPFPFFAANSTDLADPRSLSRSSRALGPVSDVSYTPLPSGKL